MTILCASISVTKPQGLWNHALLACLIYINVLYCIKSIPLKFLYKEMSIATLFCACFSLSIIYMCCHLAIYLQFLLSCGCVNHQIHKKSHLHEILALGLFWSAASNKAWFSKFWFLRGFPIWISVKNQPLFGWRLLTLFSAIWWPT